VLLRASRPAFLCTFGDRVNAGRGKPLPYGPKERDGSLDTAVLVGTLQNLG
jgi:hypothetical protein